MPRKVEDVVVEDDGRDKGKVFRLHEMPSSKGERWAIRVLMLASRSGVDIPTAVVQAGMAGIASVGILAVLGGGAPFAELEPLLDEMMTCVKMVPDPTKPMLERTLIEEDIEEISTRIFLRKKILELHTGFMKDAASHQTASS